jgi:hypothetical protein
LTNLEKFTLEHLKDIIVPKDFWAIGDKAIGKFEEDTYNQQCEDFKVRGPSDHIGIYTEIMFKFNF